MKKAFKLFFMVFVCFFMMLICNNKIEATEYFYESGTVSREYEKVKVYTFKYDYITKFTASSNYHNGSKITDGGKNLDDANFYSGSRITINYDHYNSVLPWVADVDSFQIYKYSETRENFSTLYRSFTDSTGEYVLDGEVDKEGIYKFAYVLDNEIKYVDYVYLYKNFQKMSIDFGNRYDSVSPAKKITFNLVMEDPYALNKNSYYYAFGIDTENLDFKEITNIFTSAELGMVEYRSLSKEITVNIDENVVGNTRLFVKCVRYFDEYEQMVYSKSVNVVDKIEGVVSLVDDNGNKIYGDQFYKVGTTIRFSVVLNLPVKYYNLVCLSTGDTIYLKNYITETTSFSFDYLIRDSDDNSIKIVLRTKDKELFYAIYNGVEIEVNLIYDFSVTKDAKAPEILLDTTDENREIRKSHNLELTVKDTNLSEIYYYVKACDNIIKDRCADLFDDSKASRVNSNTSEYKIQKEIGKLDGNFNEEAVAIFVKAIDKAGNETTEVFYDPQEYVIDNVICEEGVDPIIYTDTEKSKSFFVSTDESLKITNAVFYFNETKSKECDFTKNVCFSINKKYAFNFSFKVVITDIYDNSEVYYANLKNYPLKEDKMINGYKFVQNDMTEDIDYEFSTDIYTTAYDETKKILFDEDALIQIEELLSISDIDSGLSNKNISLLLVVSDEEAEYLENEIASEFYFPTLLELYNRLKNNEKYAKCAISGNTCDLETYLLYKYDLLEHPQIRKIKINVKDNTNKYIVDGFSNEIKVGVNGTFNDYDFEYVNNLNTSLQKENITESVKVFFNGIEVENVDTSRIGTYTITRTFVSSGIGSYPLSYNVVVVDEVAPTIKLKNNKDYVMKVGSPLENIENWVSVSDNYDNDVKIKYSIEPELDVNTPGSYIVSIWAIDSSGNESEVVTRTIVVKKPGLSKSTFIVLIGIIVVAVSVITLFIFIEKRKQKKVN